ncbi:DUF308 domain-containing protein [Fibrella forsythiae]|uniref:DUF308 domain-containing protein n=1 Tax=Fibrella forsythiae TaxID=2817061 RepID=A0ABS3JUG7_9BACT|nr:DUF308 domain-containing protein [Fibrella forsythiae]MBO0952844.1 DUF308 domain-containing protein [Fibrella forsythiae]
MTPTPQPAAPWWLMYLPNAAYLLMGIILLIHPDKPSSLHTGLLGGLLLLAGVATLTLGLHRRKRNQTDTDWFTLSSLRDIGFGIALLAVISEPLGTTTNVLGFWGIVYAFLQAIEANFYFLGTRSNEDKDYGVEIIHFICVLIAGGFSFLLIMRPEGFPASFRYVGLFLVALGFVQGLLTRRLQRDAIRYAKPKSE